MTSRPIAKGIIGTGKPGPSSDVSSLLGGVVELSLVVERSLVVVVLEVVEVVVVVVVVVVVLDVVVIGGVG